MIDGVVNADALPVLERMAQFAGGRHRILTHNIANFGTPDFRPVDVSVEDFQRALGAAAEQRREKFGNTGGALEVEDTNEISFRNNRIELSPKPLAQNILFHDQSDQDVDRAMQALAENAMAFRAAMDLMRSRFEILNTAIRERM